jgi:zinc transporter ZupT
LIFALGVRSLAWGSGGDAEVHPDGAAGAKAQPIGTVIGWVLFAIVLAGIALGIIFIVAGGLGKQLSFEHIFPTIVDKH